MTELILSRKFKRTPSALAVLALGAASLLETGAKGPGLFWPIVGIATVFIVAFIISKFVRGDPYYEQNANRDRRESGPVPWGGGDGGDGGSGF
jgi:hypothetical protein